MNENKKEYKINYGGKEVIVETGRLAKQADGSVLVSCEGTQVLVTACSSDTIKDGQDFFPLMVDYREKFYSAGKFLGGFMKRETRPTTHETLNSRLIDRPIRPLFPEGYLFDTIIQATVMSYDPKSDPEVLAGIGASAALTVSDIPFLGPIAFCKVGRIDGNFVLNPEFDEWPNSDMNIVVSASRDAILMVEGEANEASEAEVLEALNFAHESIKPFCEMLMTMQKEVGKTKREFISASANKTLVKKVRADFESDARASLLISEKLKRQNAVKALTSKVSEAMKENPEAFGLTSDDSFSQEAYKGVDGLLYDMMRSDILDNEKRIGGRKLDEVRPIETEVNILNSPHGSSLFTRGETQVLSTVTVGGSEGEQMVDSITGISFDKFYLHYSFPPFAVAEARGYRGVGRRELGHGNLAYRAIRAALPKDDDFGYTLRVCCEVLESNGSSSMGSVCSASMALMDAGIPLSSPVAGVAMGLVTDGKRHKILTDILGDEDHLGDMDFKIAGTEKGINSIQMDIKITGITEDIISAALKQAKKGRLHIIGEMAKTIKETRSEMRDNVPKIETFQIDKDSIGSFIGPGGKNIKGLQERYGVKIECSDDGTIKVFGQDADELKKLVAEVDMQMNGPDVGAEFNGKVVTIKEYGAFVDIAPGVSGLVHISEIANTRVNNVNDYMDEGDMVDVKVLEIDRMGRVKLSIKAVKPLEAKPGRGGDKPQKERNDRG